jgi:hypothetical protein
MHQDEDETRLPAQQTQQPQALKVEKGSGLSQQGANAIEIMDKEKEAGPGDGSRNEKQEQIIDEARINARIGELYAAFLKQPIPEDWLKRLEQMAQQERK